MQIPNSIANNLRFLGLEIDAQLEMLQAFFAQPAADIARRILDRGGYSLNLKLRIHTDCLNRLSGAAVGDTEATSLRGVEFVATELERIAELCRDCVRRARRLTKPDCLDNRAHANMLDRVRQGIAMIQPALTGNDTRLALKIGRIEQKLDRDYDALSKRYIAALQGGGNAKDLTRALFIAHYGEQMGDALRDISETIISTNLGQPLNLGRYRALQASVDALSAKSDAKDIQIATVAETRSGSAVSSLAASGDAGQGVVAIFKEGAKRKLKEERQGVESWHAIYPGLAPRILSYQKHGRSAALLIEHLPGMTFEQILLNETPDRLQKAAKQLSRTLRSVWRETRVDEPTATSYMDQLRRRLDEVYRIHPEFRRGDSQLCGRQIPSFDSLVGAASQRESTLQAPFSVYIHGDFNVDNIIYDADEKRISFIDLHRSQQTDYVQDISVFMVSNYRLQILDAPLRARILGVARDIYRVAQRFAEQSDDETFEIRLALGLARSFATSTRFILDKSLARSMFLRARYLIEQVLSTSKSQTKAFRAPIEEVFVG